MYQFVAIAAVNFVSGLMKRNEEAKQMNARIDAESLTASSRSKASGTEAILAGKRSAEQSEQTGRRALQLKGAAQASADSSNIGGTSVAAKVNDIEFQADQAIQVARANAETKRRITGMANRESYKARMYTAKNYKPQSLGKLAIGSVIGPAAGYLASEYGGQLFEDTETGAA